MFIAQGDGPHVWDADGNKYVDLIGSWGPLILGHAHPAVVEAIKKAAERGTTYGAATEAEVTLDDVMMVVSDASDLKLDPIVDAAFAGNTAVVESEFAKAMVAGTYPGVIISAAQRQAAWLHKSALAVAEGTPVSTLLESGYPRLHFSRKGAVEIALRNFNAARLAGIIDQLGTAALDMRKQASLASAIGLRTLLSIAANAKRRG